jgi:hypothetical protein
MSGVFVDRSSVLVTRRECLRLSRSAVLVLVLGLNRRFRRFRIFALDASTYWQVHVDPSRHEPFGGMPCACPWWFIARFSLSVLVNSGVYPKLYSPHPCSRLVVWGCHFPVREIFLLVTPSWRVLGQHL